MNRNHLKSLSSQLGGAKRSRRTNGTRSAFATASFILAASLLAVLLAACPSPSPTADDAAPGAPTIAKMVVGDTGKVTITWTAPEDTGITGGNGTTGVITKYTVYRSEDPITDLAATGVEKDDITGAETLTKEVTGLTDDTAYYFVVTATNATGESDASGARTATPKAAKPAAAAPNAPTGITATTGDEQVTVLWTAPVDTGYDDADGTVGNITKYTVYYSTSSFAAGSLPTDKVETTDGTVRSLDVTGLTNGTMYYFRVTATNATDEGTASDEETATPALDNTAPTFELSPITPATGVTELTITADEAITLLGADDAANIAKLTVTNDVDGTATEVTVTKVALGTDAMTVTITIDSTDFVATKKVSVLIAADFAADKAAPTPNNNAEATLEATVAVATPTVTSVAIPEGNQNLDVSGTVQLSATVTGDNNPATTVTWSSSDDNVASVSATGLVTVASGATGAQTATITATSTVDGTKSASITVTVNAATVTSVTITGGNQDLGIGGTLPLSATVVGTNNPVETVTWESSDTNKATVNADTGLVTAVSTTVGDTTVITATSTVDGTKKGTITVTLADKTGPTFTLSAISANAAATTLTIVANEDITLSDTVEADSIAKLTVTNDANTGNAVPRSVEGVDLDADQRTVTITIESTNFEAQRWVRVTIAADFAKDTAATPNSNIATTGTHLEVQVQ